MDLKDNRKTYLYQICNQLLKAYQNENTSVQRDLETHLACILHNMYILNDKEKMEHLIALLFEKLKEIKVDTTIEHVWNCAYKTIVLIGKGEEHLYAWYESPFTSPVSIQTHPSIIASPVVRIPNNKDLEHIFYITEQGNLKVTYQTITREVLKGTSTVFGKEEDFFMTPICSAKMIAIMIMDYLQYLKEKNPSFHMMPLDRITQLSLQIEDMVKEVQMSDAKTDKNTYDDKIIQLVKKYFEKA